MKIFVVAMLFAVTVPAPSQDGELHIPAVSVPRLPASGANAAAFAPKGWVVEVQASGDLNHDGKPDLAFVLQDTDRRNIVKNSGGNLGVDEINTNPRILGVAFANVSGAGYPLAAQNSKLIPRWTEPTQDDNFEDVLTIARGAVNVGLHYFANAGGWDAGSKTFTFRYQNGRFELIGVDHENHARNTGTDTSTSVNYSTHLVITRTTNDEAKINTTRRRQIPNRAIRSLETMTDGMEDED